MLSDDSDNENAHNKHLTPKKKITNASFMRKLILGTNVKFKLKEMKKKASYIVDRHKMKQGKNAGRQQCETASDDGLNELEAMVGSSDSDPDGQDEQVVIGASDLIKVDD